MQDLLNVLCCPETRQPLQIADAKLVGELNQKIKDGQVRNRGGKPITETMEAGLIREDGKYIYPVRNKIPVMLVDEAIPLQ